MVLHPIPQSLPVHFFGSRPQPPTSPTLFLWYNSKVFNPTFIKSNSLRPASLLPPLTLHTHISTTGITAQPLALIFVALRSQDRNTLQHTATHCNTHCNTLQHTATHCNNSVWLWILWHEGRMTATHCNTLQLNATHCKTLQHTASITSGTEFCGTKVSWVQQTSTHCNTMHHTATHCNILQHTATHCNTLQHTATHCNNSVWHPIFVALRSHVIHVYEWVMSRMIESCPIWLSNVPYERVMSHMNESCHIWMSHVKYAWVMSRAN